jgi:hypothetical protein
MVLEPSGGGRREVGVHEKGVAALESLLFSKYQMFRNVYWHHGVRAGTVLYKRIVFDALNGGLIVADELVGKTDEALLFLLAERAAGDSRAAGSESELGSAVQVARLVDALQRRRLPKRAVEVVAAEVGEEEGAWVTGDAPLKRRVEDALAGELGLAPRSAFLDYPRKPGMFQLDLLVRRRTGEVIRLGPGGRAGLIGLPRVSDELYRTARVLRLFTLGERARVSPEAIAGVVALSDIDMRDRLDGGHRLLA